MKLYWYKTPFTWIASKTQFRDKNKLNFDEKVNPPDDVVLLSTHLLEHGGKEVCVRFPEPDMKLILQRGYAFPTDGLTLNTGQDSECHSNSSILWLNDKRNLHICTGYGLTGDDQMWRQHTWLITKQGQKIIETTIKREMYYGVILRGLRAFLFAKMNT
jgi:hypothetical protein